MGNKGKKKAPADSDDALLNAAIAQADAERAAVSSAASAKEKQKSAASLAKQLAASKLGIQEQMEPQLCKEDLVRLLDAVPTFAIMNERGDGSKTFVPMAFANDDEGPSTEGGPPQVCAFFLDPAEAQRSLVQAQRAVLDYLQREEVLAHRVDAHRLERLVERALLRVRVLDLEELLRLAHGERDDQQRLVGVGHHGRLRRATRVAILQRIEIDRRAVANVRPRAHHTTYLAPRRISCSSAPRPSSSRAFDGTTPTRRFTLRTVALLGMQMVEAVRQMHENGCEPPPPSC